MGERIDTGCCIAGGGPAGMMLGFLLARAGIEVTVLEKHGDFLRDFRGDTIHPSTLEVMHELGLLDAFLTRPHNQTETLGAEIGNTHLRIVDFRHLPTRCKFVAFMPQWDFLDFLAEQGRRYPTFHLMMEMAAEGLVEVDGRVAGVRCRHRDGTEREIRADLIVACDGRHSTLRAAAGLEIEVLGAPIDVIWFRLPRQPEDPGQTLARIDRGHFMIMLNRSDYWQCAFVIPKGGFEAMKARGLDAFQAEILELAPYLGDRVAVLDDWDHAKLLTVAVDRLRQWHRPGLLCIGDAAHAMSPVGGVGINLAIQDAVAAANLLAEPLRHRQPVPDAVSAALQKRRLWPTQLTQRAQVLIQDRVLGPLLGTEGHTKVPWPLKLIDRFPLLQRIPARLIGLGVRPEHVRIPAAP